MKRNTIRRLKALLCKGAILALGIIPAHAQDTNAPLVTGASCDSQEHSNVAGLGDRLTISVNNLSNLVVQTMQDRHDIILYMDGQALKGLYPESIDLLKNEVRFGLQRTDANRLAWAALLGIPKHAVKKVALSVGIEDKYPIPTAIQGKNAFNLIVIRPFWFTACIVLMMVVSLWFWLKGRKSPMLRDPGPDPGPGRLRPYSLAKTQMAFWFFLIFWSFLIIWAITGAHDSVTNSVLALMGIGAGTALGVAAQNKGKESDSPLFVKVSLLELQKQDLIAKGGNTGAINAQIWALAPASKHFLTDILTDADGLSFHRFQLAVWTLVLGVIFVKEVYCNLAMPDFNETLLALMGISSGTYLGFMIPEDHSIEQSNTL
jgi:hypothetical protein